MLNQILTIVMLAVGGQAGTATPPRIGVDSDGVFNLRTDGTYSMALTVHNRCDWPQSISVTVRGDVWLTTVVPPGRSEVAVPVRRMSDQAGADFDSFRPLVEHAADRRGESVCEAARMQATVRVRWLYPTYASTGDVVRNAIPTRAMLWLGEFSLSMRRPPVAAEPRSAVPPYVPPTDRPDPPEIGDLTLRPGGRYHLGLLVQNDCDWDQAVAITTGGPLMFTNKRTVSVVARMSMPLVIEVPPNADNLWISVWHGESRQANARCLVAAWSAKYALQWANNDSAEQDGQLGSIKRLDLEQVVDDTPPPTATPPVPLTAPEETGGLTFEPTPIPGATGAGVDEDKVFDPDPTEPKKPAKPTPTAPRADTPSTQPGPSTSRARLEDINGWFVVRGDGSYAMTGTVVNECDWAQGVAITWRVVPATGGPAYETTEHATVAALGTKTFEYSVESRDRPITVSFEVDHVQQRQANKICEQVNGGSTAFLRWVGEDGNIAPSGTFYAPDEVVLPQRVLPTDTTTGGGVTTPDPKDAPATGIDIDNVANFETFPGVDPGKPTPPTAPAPGAPNEDIASRAGAFVVRPNGRYFMNLVVDNECDWDQVVNVTTGPPSVGITKRAVTVPARRSEMVIIEVAPNAPQLWISASHGAATQGNKVCTEASKDVQFSFSWTAAEGVRDSGRVGPVGNLELAQEEVPADAPTETPPSTTPGGSDDAACVGDCVPLDECLGDSCGDGPVTGSYGLDSGFQIFGAETIRVRIEISRQASLTPRRELNALGLLAKSFDQFLEWWMPTLHAAEEVTQSGLQKGLQFLITSQGGSTGKNLTMQVLNFTGRPVDLQGMIALEPLKKDAQQKVTQAFTKLAGKHLPTKLDLNGYCLEFLKLPPIAGQIMRVAGPEVQKRFAPMKRIMAAANRLTAQGALKPDSNPASYADSIKQWTLWTAEQKFNEKGFGEAFLGHTKKNVEAAGQKWTRQIEDVVRQRTPSRWQDIIRILQQAGAQVPR